jgi:hypothetical protein
MLANASAERTAVLNAFVIVDNIIFICLSKIVG